jgi:hypothetical protein
LPAAADDPAAALALGLARSLGLVASGALVQHQAHHGLAAAAGEVPVMSGAAAKIVGDHDG